MAHIRLLGTGGTIASRDTGAKGALATDAASDLLEAGYGNFTVSARDLLKTGSYRLSLADLRHIAVGVRESLDDLANDGIVLTHGTDTLEETAFLLELVHDSERTVVLTGAQKPADSPDPDGPRNVREAVLAAADERLRGTGVLISFDGVVHSARGTRKIHTTASNPFAGGVEVAHMAGSELIPTARPTRAERLPPPPETFGTTRVEIVSAYPGATPELLTFAVHSGAQAIVLAGSGVGNAGPGFAAAVAQATDLGCRVILSSRVPWGPVVPIYGNGGGTDLVEAGAIPSGDLNPFQARILAALLISLGTSAEDMPEAFRNHL